VNLAQVRRHTALRAECSPSSLIYVNTGEHIVYICVLIVILYGKIGSNVFFGYNVHQAEQRMWSLDLRDYEHAPELTKNWSDSINMEQGCKASRYLPMYKDYRIRLINLRMRSLWIDSWIVTIYTYTYIIHISQ